VDWTWAVAQLLPVPEQELGPQELELSRGSQKQNTPPSGMNRIWTRTACNLDIPALRAVKDLLSIAFAPLPIGGLVGSMHDSGHTVRARAVSPVP
jgi:hypothetical protein